MTEPLATALKNLNLEACRRYRPELFNLLQGRQLSGDYVLVTSDHESGINNLVDLKNELLYYEQADPLGSMASHIETCINKLQGIMVCLGFGLGYGPLMLVGQRNYVSRSIIIIEPNPEILLLAFESLDCRSIIESEDVLFCVGDNIEWLATDVTHHLGQHNRLVNAKNLQIIDLPSSLGPHREHHLAAVKKITHAINQAVKLTGNCPNDALQGLDTTLSNLFLHSQLPGLKSLANCFEGKAGVVVSAGPSLDRNISQLKNLDDSFVVCSVDASLKRLLSEGIQPNFVTSVERVSETAKFFEGLEPEDVTDTFLVGSPVCHPAIFSSFPGPVISCEREQGYFELLGLDKGQLNPGPSTGNMAFRLLQYLGCNPIILVGQDLALADDGRTHAGGVEFGDHQQGYLFDSCLVEGNNQQEVRTNPILQMFHQAYEYDVKNFGGLVINATEGGARIAGTTIKDLAEAINWVKTESTGESQGPVLSNKEAVLQKLEQPTATAAVDACNRIAGSIEDALQYLETVELTINDANDAVSDFEALSKNIKEIDKRFSREELMKRMESLAELTFAPMFKKTAHDVLSSTFFHTMVDYTRALADSASEDQQETELINNMRNIVNNFKVLLRFVRELYKGHLNLLKEQLSSIKAQTQELER